MIPTSVLEPYTAALERDTKGVVGCLPRLRAASAVINWDECPVLTEGQRRRSHRIGIPNLGRR